MNMATVEQALSSIEVPVYQGYAATGAKLPYMVVRPISTDPDGATVCGEATTWTDRLGVYCCAGSVGASANLARDAAGEIVSFFSGVSATTVAVAYYGNVLEGQYESLVTITVTEGGL